MGETIFQVGQRCGGNLIIKVGTKIHFDCRGCQNAGETTRDNAVAWLAEGRPFLCRECRKRERVKAERQRALENAKLKSAKIHDRRFVICANGSQRIALTIDCSDCGRRFEGLLMSLVGLESKAQPLRCEKCIKASRAKLHAARKAKVGYQPVPRNKSGVTHATLRRLDALPPKIRKAAEALMRRHIAACAAEGTNMEALDRIYSEAIEVAQVEALEAKEEWLPTEPFRHYSQYTSPLAEA